MNKGKSVRSLHLERRAMWDSSMRNHERYINKETGLFEARYLEYRCCPVCESAQSVNIFTKSGGSYVKCNDCGMVYLNPVFKKDELIAYYQVNHDEQSKIVESDISFYSDLYIKGLEKINNRLLIDRDGILDIGCSAGIFLDIAKNKGWSETYGVELNKSEANLAIEKGHTVYTQPIEIVNFNRSFATITMWDVFEHINDGANFLRLVKSILSPGGVVFMQIPNSASLAARILHEKCNMFDGLEHVNLYDDKTIKMLSNRVGFEVVSIDTVISEIGVINNYLQYEDPYCGPVDSRMDISGLIDESNIHSKNLGYKMQIVLVQK